MGVRTPKLKGNNKKTKSNNRFFHFYAIMEETKDREEKKMEFREKLKKLRNEKKISQQVLADAIFVSRSAVAKWESGLGMPCDESMRALEGFFGVECDSLLTDKPDEVIVKKNIRMRKAAAVFGAAASALIIILSILLAISVLCKSYGLTSKMAAGEVFYDNLCLHNEDYDIYYSTMDILWSEGEYEPGEGKYISGFRPVRKLFIGYGVFEEDYAYRNVYSDEGYVGILYSIRGKDRYYNILMKKTNVFPADLLVFDRITADGREYEVQLNSYFITEERPQALAVGETSLRIGPLEYR